MKLIPVFLLLIVFPFAKGQTGEYPVDYESLTYRLFTESKWDSLLIKGKEAIKSGSDYFYIYVRTGAAAYHLKKYALASMYLEKARILNASDNYTNELLFYSYLNTARNNSAKLLTNEIGYGDSLYSEYIHPVYYAEGGLMTTDDPAERGKGRRMKEIKYNYREQFKENTGLYFVTGWNQPLGTRTSLHAAISYTKISKERNITVKNYDSVSGDYSVKQSEFYLAPSFIPVTRLLITPSFRYSMTAISEPLSGTDSLVKKYQVSQISSNYFNFNLGSEFTYYRNYWHAKFGFWFLDLNSRSGFQSSASIFLLPLGNTGLYTNSEVTWKNDRPQDPFIFTQMIGLKLYKETWLELSYTNGNLAGTVENNAQILNNQIEDTDYRLTGLLFADITRHIRIVLRCQYIRSNGTIYYTDIENAGLNQNYKFSRQILTGGLTWNIF